MNHEDKSRNICEECATKGRIELNPSEHYEWYKLSTVYPCYVCGSTKGRCAQLFCFRLKER